MLFADLLKHSGWSINSQSTLPLKKMNLFFLIFKKGVKYRYKIHK